MGLWKPLVKIETPLASYCATLSSSHSRNHVSASRWPRDKNATLAAASPSNIVRTKLNSSICCVHTCRVWHRYVFVSRCNFPENFPCGNAALRNFVVLLSPDVVRSFAHGVLNRARFNLLGVSYRCFDKMASAYLRVVIFCWYSMSGGSSEISWLWLLQWNRNCCPPSRLWSLHGSYGESLQNIYVYYNIIDPHWC